MLFRLLDLLFDMANDLGCYHAFLYSVHEGLEQRAIEFNKITHESDHLSVATARKN
jgi:hypothetical protein